MSPPRGVRCLVVAPLKCVVAGAAPACVQPWAPTVQQHQLPALQSRAIIIIIMMTMVALEAWVVVVEVVHLWPPSRASPRLVATCPAAGTGAGAAFIDDPAAVAACTATATATATATLNQGEHAAAIPSPHMALVAAGLATLSLAPPRPCLTMLRWWRAPAATHTPLPRQCWWTCPLEFALW